MMGLKPVLLLAVSLFYLVCLSAVGLWTTPHRSLLILIFLSSSSVMNSAVVGSLFHLSVLSVSSFVNLGKVLTFQDCWGMLVGKGSVVGAGHIVGAYLTGSIHLG